MRRRRQKRESLSAVQLRGENGSRKEQRFRAAALCGSGELDHGEMLRVRILEGVNEGGGRATTDYRVRS